MNAISAQASQIPPNKSPIAEANFIRGQISEVKSKGAARSPNFSEEAGAIATIQPLQLRTISRCVYCHVPEKFSARLFHCTTDCFHESGMFILFINQKFFLSRVHVAGEADIAHLPDASNLP